VCIYVWCVFECVYVGVGACAIEWVCICVGTLWS